MLNRGPRPAQRAPQPQRKPKGTWIAVIGAACIALTTACTADQADQVRTTGGAAGSVGSIQVRDAQFVWRRPVTGDTVYEPGDDAPIQVTIVNDATGKGADDRGADRLVTVSSPIATSGRIVGDARIPDGQTLTAGYEQSHAATNPPRSGQVAITLVGLTEPIQAGRTYPVDFTFEHAGRLRIALPVENPPFNPAQKHQGGTDASAVETPR